VMWSEVVDDKLPRIGIKGDASRRKWVHPLAWCPVNPFLTTEMEVKSVWIETFTYLKTRSFAPCPLIYLAAR
jgi:hypothetical protein